MDCFWINPTWSAYVITVDGKWAGFALTNDDVITHGNTRAIFEFFVVRKYRRRGVGRHAAQTIMEMSPANWEIRVLEKNEAARRFWAALLDEVWPATHHMATLNNEHWQGPVFSVDTRTSGPKVIVCSPR